MNPINGKPGNNYNASGKYCTEVCCRTNPEKIITNRVKFNIYVSDGNIVDARWEIFGDPVASAVSSWCVQSIRGKQIDEVANLIVPERAALELDITNEADIRGGCMAAIGALADAFDNYRKS